MSVAGKKIHNIYIMLTNKQTNQWRTKGWVIIRNFVDVENCIKDMQKHYPKCFPAEAKKLLPLSIGLHQRYYNHVHTIHSHQVHHLCSTENP